MYYEGRWEREFFEERSKFQEPSNFAVVLSARRSRANSFFSFVVVYRKIYRCWRLPG
jgi:hypothetical protein